MAVASHVLLFREVLSTQAGKVPGLVVGKHRGETELGRGADDAHDHEPDGDDPLEEIVSVAAYVATGHRVPPRKPVACSIYGDFRVGMWSAHRTRSRVDRPGQHQGCREWAAGSWAITSSTAYPPASLRCS